MGRPRKDTVDVQKIIINLAKSGMTNQGIADATGLTRKTVWNWLKETDLGESVRAVRETNAMLEASQKFALNKSAVLAAKKLLKKRKVEEVIERTDNSGKLLYTETRRREIDPNASIVQFVLKNTDPQNWRDNPEPQDMDGAEDNELVIEIEDGGNED